MENVMIVLIVINVVVAVAAAVIVLRRKASVEASDVSNPALLFVLAIAAAALLFGRPDQAFEVASTLVVGGSAALAAAGLTALSKTVREGKRSGTMMILLAIGSYLLPLAAAALLAAKVMSEN
ncbi:hypothetical protein ACX80Z_11940 [Arthrobacter sp. TMT4-20]